MVLIIIAYVPMALRIQITILKIRQYLLRANLPNLMLTKFSRYTAVYAMLARSIGYSILVPLDIVY